MDFSFLAFVDFFLFENVILKIPRQRLQVLLQFSLMYSPYLSSVQILSSNSSQYVIRSTQGNFSENKKMNILSGIQKQLSGGFGWTISIIDFKVSLEGRNASLRCSALIHCKWILCFIDSKFVEWWLTRCYNDTENDETSWKNKISYYLFSTLPIFPPKK